MLKVWHKIQQLSWHCSLVCAALNMTLEGLLIYPHRGFHCELNLFVLNICCLVLFTQKAIKPLSFNIHWPEHCSLLTERYWFVSKPTVMELFPVSFDFYSGMLFAWDDSTLLLCAQQVMMELGRGGIKELFVDLCNRNFVRCFLKLAFGISWLRLCWSPRGWLQWFRSCFWSCRFWSSCCFRNLFYPIPFPLRLCHLHNQTTSYDTREKFSNTLSDHVYKKTSV